MSDESGIRNQQSGNWTPESPILILLIIFNIQHIIFPYFCIIYMVMFIHYLQIYRFIDRVFTKEVHQGVRKDDLLGRSHRRSSGVFAKKIFRCQRVKPWCGQTVNRRMAHEQRELNQESRTWKLEFRISGTDLINCCQCTIHHISTFLNYSHDYIYLSTVQRFIDYRQSLHEAGPPGCSKRRSFRAFAEKIFLGVRKEDFPHGQVKPRCGQTVSRIMAHER